MNSDYTSSRRNRSLPILIVEDNQDHQLLIGYSLLASVPEAEAVFAATPEETFSHLDRCLTDQIHFPQLVLLDIHLPQPEVGWQLLQDLRTRYPRLPVLVLSSYQDKDYVKQAYELGAHSFIGKPVDLQDWEYRFQSLRTYWLGVVTLPPTY